MTEYKKGEVPQKLLDKAKNLKKTDKTVEKLQELDDTDVDSVAGGFRKRTGYASGCRVLCPVCGCRSREGIYSWENDSYEVSVFYCENCDYTWALDREGFEWDDF